MVKYVQNIIQPSLKMMGNARKSNPLNLQSGMKNQQHMQLDVNRIKTIAEVDEEFEERSSMWGGCSEPASKNGSEGHEIMHTNSNELAGLSWQQSIPTERRVSHSLLNSPDHKYLSNEIKSTPLTSNMFAGKNLIDRVRIENEQMLAGQ